LQILGGLVPFRRDMCRKFYRFHDVAGRGYGGEGDRGPHNSGEDRGPPAPAASAGPDGERPGVRQHRRRVPARSAPGLQSGERAAPAVRDTARRARPPRTPGSAARAHGADDR